MMPPKMGEVGVSKAREAGMGFSQERDFTHSRILQASLLIPPMES